MKRSDRQDKVARIVFVAAVWAAFSAPPALADCPAALPELCVLLN